MLELRAVTDIEASADQVWTALTDLSRYHEWNPFIREASGTPAVGARVRVAPRTSLGLRLAFRPTIVACDPPRELRWHGHFLASWLAAGDHRFTIEAAGPGRVRFAQSEIFTGPLARLAQRLVARETRRGFDAMNRALKRRVEGAAEGA